MTHARVPIGVTLNYRVTDDGGEQAYLDSNYLDYLTDAGAIPVPIIPTSDNELLGSLLDMVGGVMLTGGFDLNATLWGQPLHPKATLLHPQRQNGELLVYRMAKERQLPILAICLGIQVINVAHGGTIHQHVTDLHGTVEHEAPSNSPAQRAAGIARHTLTLTPGSHLHEWFNGQRITVNSFHHQSVDHLGTRLNAAAIADDGLVEAIEQPGYPFLLAVQWHPERDKADHVSSVIIERFISAAGRPV